MGDGAVPVVVEPPRPSSQLPWVMRFGIAAYHAGWAMEHQLLHDVIVYIDGQKRKYN